MMSFNLYFLKPLKRLTGWNIFTYRVLNSGGFFSQHKYADLTTSRSEEGGG
jgi:hypothetical protein